MYGGYSSTATMRTSAASRFDHSSYSAKYHQRRNYSSSVLPSKPDIYYPSSSGYGKTTYSTSFSRALDNDNLVRPAIRHSSMTRGSGSSRRSHARESSVPRSGTDYYRNSSQTTSFSKERGREASPKRRSTNSKYSNSGITSTRNPRAASPATRKPPPVPEFTTIQSKSGTKTRSPSLSNGSLLNGHSPVHIEVKRTIAKPEEYEPTRYTPSLLRNKTTNNNKDHDKDVSSSSRSSTASHKEEPYQNGFSKLTLSSSSSRRDFHDVNAGLVGLKNIGNTCFMNSILQCLSNTRSLRNYCIDEKYLNEINHRSPMKGKLMEAFSDIVQKLWHPKSSVAVPTSPFKSQIQKFSKRFSGYDQQDCQEFMRFLIEGLHEDVNKAKESRSRTMPNFDSHDDETKAVKTWQFYLSKDHSFIVDLFMGQLKSSLECHECHHVSVTFDPFWDLSLPLPKNSYSRFEDKLDIQSCLESFTGKEILSGDERPTCDKCKARRKMTKKFTIHRFPKILVIHLKRFSEGRYRQKLSTSVEFAHKLNIRSPISTSSGSFDLYAVSNHSGSCYGGHYTAYCKNPETTDWHCFSDSIVSQISPSSVQSREAYVLFYENTTSSRSQP